MAEKSESLLYGSKTDREEAVTSNFIWKKKHEKIGIDRLDFESLSELHMRKQSEAKNELEKLKKRKIEREKENEEREREREFLQRQKEADYHKEWEKQEDSFHLQQVKLRSKIRIEEARAKPIDLLAKYIDEDDDDLDVHDMHEPYTYLNGLTIRDLEDLLVDIKVYSSLEKNKHNDYWNEITIVTEDELKKLQRLDPNYKDQARDSRENINQSVLQDVSGLFKGKTCEQLILLEQNINEKIKEKVGIDIGYWESVLSQLKAHKARARLREQHQQVLYSKLQKLKKQQGITQQNVFPIPVAKERQESREEEKRASISGDEEPNSVGDTSMDAEEVDNEEDWIELYDTGNYSPKLMQPDDLSFDTFIITTEEDLKRIEFQRMQVLKGGSVKSTEEEFEKRARETMDGTASAPVEAEEENAGDFKTEVTLQHHYNWSDKYRPRKPRYYNRVHTGYDWNQYNKKHYDTDNPPPKTVQGYKFNIFYPDLIDKTKTPTYSIHPCKDNTDFAVLRFHAGAPYEDVAFKIVSREWDISHRHGFRNQFQNGILQVWFHFRKWKYRR